MIQAQSYATEAIELDIPVQKQNIRVKKTYTHVNGRRIFVIKTGIFLFAYALLLVYLCIKSATLGYQIVELQKQIATWETSNKRIEYQIASQTSLQRIEKIATKDLGMCKPDASSMLQIAVQSESAHTADSSPKTEVKQASKDENTLQKVYKTIAIMIQ